MIFRYSYRRFCSSTKKTVIQVKNLYLQNRIDYHTLKIELSTMPMEHVCDAIKKTECSLHQYQYTTQKEQNLLLSFINEAKRLIGASPL